MNEKLLSIVVPTKNRYYYLKYLITLVSSLKSNEVELVIQDNSDDNSEFVNYLKEQNFDFIRYDYIKGQIPMSENSDKGILNSTGEYICFLGDDDGVTKNIIEGVQWMKKNNIEAVKPAHPYYFWPDASGAHSAEIVYNRFTGRVKYVRPIKELYKVLRKGITNRGDMPIAYHAIVSRSVLNKVYEKCGTFFPGNSPDIANAVALSLVVKRFVLVDYPWAYSGNGAYRGGGVHAKGNANPEIKDIPWFRPNAEEEWYYKLPKLASGSIIWADSAIHALIAMGREDLIKEVSFYKIYANFLRSLPYKKSLISPLINNHLHFDIYMLYFKIKTIVMAAGRRIGWISGIIHRPLVEKDVLNIIEATERLESLSSLENDILK